ncbi:DNA-processing protein DprA [Winogradskyella arenosi]|uniref:DNA processing protein n=1 Tax=Winogradskyella arenosi TaxID=533325 RepID=A0A368ZNL8_9FLAO|nr:DNA-processing protein DprA [Winogradskyella arenosi]RCW93523.1 DNA processing protein [Winogradskyella arenosi]
MTDQELIYALALQHIPKIGSTTAKKLIKHCGSPEAVLKEKPSTLLKIDGIGALTAKGIADRHHIGDAEQELKFIKQHNIKVLYFTEDHYPERLKHCIDGPVVLFQSGAINIKNQRIISIVGARKITTHGIAFCEKLVENLAPYNPIIVSGFAYGTDITAQKAAVKHNLQTIGCLAHGLNQIYPKVHKKYVAAVEAHGGFFTDFWSTDTFDRNNFLKRNRIIAGLSEATLVIESAEKGGSLVTADIANSYNREVFAVPGRTTDSQSVGCNNLIKSQQAHLLSTPLDVPYMLNWELEADKKAPVQTQLFVTLTPNEQMVFDYLKVNDKSSLDHIALACGIPTYKLASLLLNLELKDLVRPLPGKLFQLIAK